MWSSKVVNGISPTAASRKLIFLSMHPDGCETMPTDFGEKQIEKCMRCRHVSKSKKWCCKHGFFVSRPDSLARRYRIYCTTCPGPSGRHENEHDTFFRSCSICLLLGIKPDGTRQNLQEWWQSGGDCPLGHWPPAEQRHKI